MSQKRSMRKIRELLRLKYELGRSHREIAASLGVANSTVSDYVRRARAAGFSWPLPARLNDAALEAALFPAPLGCLPVTQSGAVLFPRQTLYTESTVPQFSPHLPPKQPIHLPRGSQL